MPRYSSSSKTPAQLNREITEALAGRLEPHQCYACDATASGVRDRRPEGGNIEAACARHAEPVFIPQRGTTTARGKRAHATRNKGLRAYRNLIEKAIARCSKHPRPNHSLYECVFEEVHHGAPYPTPQMRRILEEAVHAARPASNLQGGLQHGNAHARKKKLEPREAKQRLKTAGIDFSNDFHQLPRSQVQLILDTARAAGYRKSKGAPGSTARMYFQYLSRLR